MQIGILQTGLPPEGIAPGYGSYPDMFERLLAGHGFGFRTWSVVESEFPESVAAADGWLITGSRHGAYEAHEWIAPLEQFIRDVRDDGRPMVGICFGHQIMAQALGGTVEKFAGGWSIGRTRYRFGDREVVLNAWHQDQVTRPPEGAETIASSDFCRYAGLAYGSHMFSLQPHPEYAPAFIGELIRHRGAAIPEALKRDALATLEGPTDSTWIAERIAGYFKQHAKERT